MERLRLLYRIIIIILVPISVNNSESGQGIYAMQSPDV